MQVMQPEPWKRKEMRKEKKRKDTEEEDPFLTNITF